MTLEALTPTPPLHRRVGDLLLDSSPIAKRSKRTSEDEHIVGCLRRGGEASATPTGRIHKCSVCGKGFPSHQALGGHKASHRVNYKPPANGGKPSNSMSDPQRPHTCSTCGRSFSIGQALGGHMRKHYGGSVIDGNGDAAAHSRNFDLNLPPSQEIEIKFLGEQCGVGSGPASA